jgi:predicted ATPase/DNA-binding winged helix-turn-helix (wHTH) protein
MAPGILRFADFELDRNVYELRRNAHPLKLERIPLDLLFLLIEKRGQLVTREEILERLWGKGVFFDVDNAINSAVRKLRRALGDDPEAPRFVLTVPTKGYRFVAELDDLSPRPPRRAKKVGRASSGRLTQSPMAGRQTEMALLRNGLKDAASGRGHVFLISGEPGVGKTRLADEIAAAAEAKQMTVLVGHCSERDEAVAYLPFVEVLEKFIVQLRGSDQLRTAFGDEGPDLARLVPRLRSLLPELPPPLEMEPAQARRHLFNSFCDFIDRRCEEQPALVILEDLHWADDSTLSLLDHLTLRLSVLPLMIVGTYRDAQMDVARGLADMLDGLLRRRMIKEVRLKGLGRDEVASMLTSLSGKSAPNALVNKIHAGTEGNPFFVEELFRHLEEENRLFDSSGRFRSDLEGSDLEAPPGVRLVVARRVERLKDSTQKMLALAAVIGRFFSFELLNASSKPDAESFLECIEEAEKAGLIFPVAEGERTGYEFSHELIRQTVVASISPARRQTLHLAIADAIERIYSISPESRYENTPDNYIGDLAHHYGRGGNRPKAIQYLRLAAQQCIQRSASGEAIDHLTNALRILKTLPGTEQRDRQESALQTMLGPALIATRGNAAPEVGAAYERAVEVGRRVGEDARLFPVLFGLRSFHFVRGELRPASKLAEQLVILAEGTQDSGFQIEAHLALGNSLYVFGDLTPALEYFERAMSLYKPQEHRAHAFVYGVDPGVFCLGRIGWVLEFQGYPDRALLQAEWALALAHEQLHPYSLAMAIMHLRSIYFYRREWSAVQQQAEGGISIANVRAQAMLHLGCALAEQGLTDRGIALIYEGLAAIGTTNQRLFRPAYLLYLARALLKGSRFEEGLAAITEATTLMEETGERMYESEIRRAKGELLLEHDPANAAQAEQLFHDAIRVSRRQGARLFELRATINLARLLAQHGRREEAHEMLAEIYNRFTEGFDLPDLKDAKALLDELSDQDR